jgi:hypothetical protein
LHASIFAPRFDPVAQAYTGACRIDALLTALNEIQASINIEVMHVRSCRKYILLISNDRNSPSDGREQDYWFPAKTYGWGWGLPVKWQGWLVFIGYFALQYLGIQHFKAQHNVKGLFVYLLLVTGLFILTVVLKGERPTGWRWGKK